MYAAQANSPYAEITGSLDTSVQEIYVNDASVLPSETPFLLTIGFDTSTSETVLVTDVSGNQLTVVRGVDGPAQIWVAGVKCARVFTAKDLNDLQENIRTLLTNLNSVGTKVGTATLDTTATDLSAAINEHEADIVGLRGRTDVITGTVTLTNSSDYPFNNSVVTVPINSARDNANYIVDYYVTASSGGNVGDIIISDKLVNGFKIEHTGSATSVTVKYLVLGGMT